MKNMRKTFYMIALTTFIWEARANTVLNIRNNFPSTINVTVTAENEANQNVPFIVTRPVDQDEIIKVKLKDRTFPNIPAKYSVVATATIQPVVPAGTDPLPSPVVVKSNVVVVDIYEESTVAFSQNAAGGVDCKVLTAQ